MTSQTLIQYWQTLTGFDLCLLAIILLSLCISLFRGALREVIGTMTWVLAAIAAVRFNHWFAQKLVPYIDSPPLRSVIAVVSLVIAILLLGALFNFLTSKLVKQSGLSGFDRFLGVLFGSARGVVLAVLVILGGQMMHFDDSSWWKKSQVVHYFKPMTKWMQQYALTYMNDFYSEYVNVHVKKKPESLGQKVASFVKEEIKSQDKDSPTPKTLPPEKAKVIHLN